MSEKEKTLHQILTSTQTGTIVCRIAKELGISTYEAFTRFFKSKTYAQFRIPGSIFSMLSDPALVDEYFHE